MKKILAAAAIVAVLAGCASQAGVAGSTRTPAGYQWYSPFPEEQWNRPFPEQPGNNRWHTPAPPA